jgi:hypothetical protein
MALIILERIFGHFFYWSTVWIMICTNGILNVFIANFGGFQVLIAWHSNSPSRSEFYKQNFAQIQGRELPKTKESACVKPRHAKHGGSAELKEM